MRKFVISLVALVAIAAGLLLAQQGNQVIPAGGGTAAPSATVFYAALNCSGLSNCFQFQAESAPGAGTPDNCGSALTTWVTAINAVVGSSGPVVYILAPGNGQAALFLTCHLAFEPVTHGVNTFDSFYCSGTLDAGANSGANLIQFGDGTHSDGEFSWQGCTFTGGASLTAAGMETLNNVVQLNVSGTTWYNFGAGNATIGTCTNYAIKMDNFIFQGNITFNNWISQDTTAGRCGFNNASTTAGEGTINFQANEMEGNSAHCSGVLISDGGSMGMMDKNNLGNAAEDMLLSGNSHRIEFNQLDTEGCTPTGGNSGVIQVSGSSAAPIPDVIVHGNTVNGGAGHATNFITTAPGVSSSPFQAWTITDNVQAVTTSTGVNVVAPSVNTVCAGRITSHIGCYESGNQDMVPNLACGTTNTGWQVGTNLADCVANTSGANIGSTLAFTQYNGTNTNSPRIRVNCQIMLITAATTSSTLPQCEVQYTEVNTGGSITVIVTPVWAATTAGCAGSTTNTVGNTCTGTVYINPKPNTTVNFLTINYASVGGTSMVARAYVDAENAYAQ